MVNIGVIGCGRVANLHLGAYRHIPEANVVAVSDIDLEKAKLFAQNYDISKVYNNYLDILEMKDLDFVTICTPTSTHAKIATEAARFGHNILLEKPMARTTVDCDKIIQEVAKNRVKLCVCHNQIFIPQVTLAKSIVESEEFDLASFRVSIKEAATLIGAPSWTITPEEGGILWESGCHAAYLQLHFLKDAAEVFATGSKIKHPVYDHFAALVHTPNHALGIIEVSWLATDPEVLFEYMSSDGKRMQIVNYNYFSRIPEKLPKSILKGFYFDLKTIIRKWKTTAMDNLRKGKLMRYLPHYILVGKYIESLRDDIDPPVKPEDGRKAIKLLESIESSLEKQSC